MKSYIMRPVARLLRYRFLLKALLEHTPAGHKDQEGIPLVIGLLESLEIELGIISPQKNVELSKYNSNIIFQQREPNRDVSGKELRRLLADRRDRTWICSTRSGLSFILGSFFVNQNLYSE